MRTYLIITALLAAVAANGQDTAVATIKKRPQNFGRNSYTATVVMGIANGYKTDYNVPNGFAKGNVTGFAPVYARVEYGVSNRVSIAIGASFNTIHYNTTKIYQGYNGAIYRNATNKHRLFSGGIMAFYHFRSMLGSKKLDPFVGVGLSINNINQSAYPQGDSTTTEQRSHNAMPFLKAGLRYYVSNIFSLYADAGYDKLSVASVGVSCRFAGKK